MAVKSQTYDLKKMFQIMNPIAIEKRNNKILALTFSIFIEAESKENEIFPHNSMPNKL